MVCKGWAVKISVRMIGMVRLMIGMVGKVGIGGFVYEGGKVDSAWGFPSKNGSKFQKPPPVKCIIFT